MSNAGLWLARSIQLIANALHEQKPPYECVLMQAKLQRFYPHRTNKKLTGMMVFNIFPNKSIAIIVEKKNYTTTLL